MANRWFVWMVALFGVVALLLAMGVWPASVAADTGPVKEGIEAEIEAYYTKAHPEVQEYIRWTAKTFGRGGLWMDAGAYDGLTDVERQEKIAYLKLLLEEGEYGRHLCEGVTQAGVLGDPALLVGVAKVAAYHREGRDYDCRAKWMAVAALGRIGDERAVPTLVPLVDHGNLNTRMWARASLARLTGQTFDTDKQAWADWWNGAGKKPALGHDAVKPWVPPAPRDRVSQARTTPAPVLVKTTPVIGDGAVSPGLTKLRVTFDQDMSGGFSWTGGGDAFPEFDGAAKWIDKRTCERGVKLEPGKFYRVGINAPSYRNFRSAQGVPVVPTVLWFVTAGEDGKPVSELQPPKVVALSPANGAVDVDVGTTALTVTFNRRMAGGFSWTDPEKKAPEIPSKPAWGADAKTCTLPVKLESGREYVMSLNLGWYLNFRSEAGVPLVPVRYTFSTP